MINVSLSDAGNVRNHALKKIMELGYHVSIIDESACFPEQLLFVAEKNNKFFLEKNELRLLGVIMIVEKYGNNWSRKDNISHSFLLNLKE